jgi:hypothetical protein
MINILKVDISCQKKQECIQFYCFLSSLHKNENCLRDERERERVVCMLFIFYFLSPVIYLQPLPLSTSRKEMPLDESNCTLFKSSLSCINHLFHTITLSKFEMQQTLVKAYLVYVFQKAVYVWKKGGGVIYLITDLT